MGTRSVYTDHTTICVDNRTLICAFRKGERSPPRGCPDFANPEPRSKCPARRECKCTLPRPRAPPKELQMHASPAQGGHGETRRQSGPRRPEN
eukprot:9415133-Pyramimonas_sp.AAC.1